MVNQSPGLLLLVRHNQACFPVHVFCFFWTLGNVFCGPGSGKWVNEQVLSLGSDKTHVKAGLL